MLLHDRGYRRTLEGNVASEHLVENNAETINIGARVWLFVRPLLRRHIKWRAHQPACLRLHKRSQQLARPDLGQAEIKYSEPLRHRHVLTDHDIERLEIA